jgi:hypothetical protein
MDSPSPQFHLVAPGLTMHPGEERPLPPLPSSGTASASSMGLIVRRAVLFMLALGAFLLPPLIDDPGLRYTIPLFCLVVVLQLAPVLWPSNPDIWAPVSAGLMGSASTLATLASFIAAGRIELAFVRGLDEDGVASLARKVLLATALSHCCYYAGYYHRAWGLALSRTRLYPRMAGLVWQRSRFVLFTAACLAVFAVSYAVFQSRLNVSVLEIRRLSAGKAVFRDDSTLTWLLRGIQLGFLPIFIWFARVLPTRQNKVSTAAAMACAVVVGILSIRTGIRGVAFISIMVLVVNYHYLRRRISVLVLVGLMLVGLTLSNTLFRWRADGMYDTAMTRVDENADIKDRVVAELANHEADRQKFSSVALLFNEFPRNYDYLLGESYLGLVAVFIPRWIWPEKYSMFEWRDTLIVGKLGGGQNPTSLLGLFYVNFSWIGVIVGFGLLGVFHRGLYEWMLRTPRDPNVVLLYSLILVFFSPTLLAISATIGTVLPVWLALRFIGKRPDSTQASALAA